MGVSEAFVTSELARVRPWLEPALAETNPLWTWADVCAAVLGDRAQLWAGDKSAMVTTVSDYHSTGERVIEVWLGGGDLDDLVSRGMPIAERWAKDAGCTQAHIVGRPGWARALASHGFAPWALTVRKILSPPDRTVN